MENRKPPDKAPRAFLIRKRGTKNPAHIWLGSDTVCRMASTGGLPLSRYAVHPDHNGREICQICRNVMARDRIEKPARAQSLGAVRYVSEAEIEAAKSPRGGWTAATLAGWGVAWPPPRGWRARLAMRPQTEE